MRAATYAVAAAPGDKAAAECGVYFFGAGQGGTVEANIERWKSQFRAPGGKPAAAEVAARKVRDLTITTIDTSGDYSGMVSRRARTACSSRLPPAGSHRREPQRQYIHQVHRSGQHDRGEPTEVPRAARVLPADK